MSITIHIGYHKTATTWLQRLIFPNHPEIDYWNIYTQPYAWVMDVGSSHDFDFDPQRFKELSSQLKADSLNGNNLISWEGFVGDPFTGAITSHRNANRLQLIFPNAKIIVGIRNQFDMVASLYRQYVHEGGACSFSAFLKQSNKRTRIHFSLDYMRFDRLITYYASLFGRDSIFVYTYEELKQSPNDVLGGLFSFLEVSSISFDDHIYKNQVNRGMSRPSIHIMRLTNRLIGSTINSTPVIPHRIANVWTMRRFLQYRLDPLLPDSFFSSEKLSDSEEKYLRNYFSNGNQILKEKFNLPLEKYDYPLS